MDDSIRRAIIAAGGDPDAVESIARSEGVIPTDEEEAEKQRFIAAGGLRCYSCNSVVDPNHVNTMREVVGWDRPRAQGGQNHVWFREETGRLMCEECGVRRRYGGQAAQETLV